MIMGMSDLCVSMNCRQHMWGLNWITLGFILRHGIILQGGIVPDRIMIESGERIGTNFVHLSLIQKQSFKHETESSVLQI